MARKMALPEFQREQQEHCFDPHIAPINRLVDELRNDSARVWAPYVAPMYGGINARLLSLLRDPGPKTLDKKGSGFLCMENDDPTAEAISGFFADVNIFPTDIVPWNVYPWYINRAPKAAELDAGTEPLRRVIDLLPNLSVIMLHGGSARNGWKRFASHYAQLVAKRNIKVISTYHTSRQAFWHRDPCERERRREHLRSSFREAASCLNCF